jgi:uncharacterized protein YjbI with pentapeptide repeats
MATVQRSYQIINNTEIIGRSASKKEYECYEFVNCTFDDLSQFSFMDCNFKNCNLSNVKTMATRIQYCNFKDCKLLGANLSGIRDQVFEAHFDNCLMDYCSFDQRKLNRSSFKNCKMHSVNFTQADLSKCTLSGCDLFESQFSRTNLSGIDFTENRNFMIDPETNTIKGARFLSVQLAGLLYRHKIVID